jgi:GT2 family glycosyltransferase
VSEPPQIRHEEVTAIVVNHDSGSRLARLLEHLAPQVGAVVVVDNASSDGSADPAASAERSTLVANERNVGFATAANQGAALAAATTEWLLFANPDTEPGPLTVSQLLKDLRPDVAIVAPLQADPNGHPRNESAGYDLTLSRLAVWALLPASLAGKRGPWIAPPYLEEDAEVDWVSGAMMAVRRGLFTRLHGFDDSLFLYLEDADLCRRARTTGARVVLRGGLRVPHEVGQADPERRALQMRLWVQALSTRFSGTRRRMLGVVLATGFALRAAFGPRPVTRRSARAGLGPSFRLILDGSDAA